MGEGTPTPQIGDEFVWLEGEEDGCNEIVDTIADVLTREGAAWCVEVGHAAVHRVPPIAVFRGVQSFPAHMTRHWIVWYDGRWYHEAAAERVRARTTLPTPTPE